MHRKIYLLGSILNIMQKPCQVTFYFDKEKDLINIYNACNSQKKWGETLNIQKHLLDTCKGKTYDLCKNELVEQREQLYNSKLILIFIGALTKCWEEIENEYFKRLGFIIKHKTLLKADGYITTIGKCPYNPKDNSFMVCLFSNLPQAMKNTGHEIFHLHFHKYFFADIEKQIGREKTHDLKEALTILLNLEFKDLWFADDKGYPNHKELREFIEQEWKKEKNFSRLLEKLVKRAKAKV